MWSGISLALESMSLVGPWPVDWPVGSWDKSGIRIKHKRIAAHYIPITIIKDDSVCSGQIDTEASSASCK